MTLTLDGTRAVTECSCPQAAASRHGTRCDTDCNECDDGVVSQRPGSCALTVTEWCEWGCRQCAVCACVPFFFHLVADSHLRYLRASSSTSSRRVVVWMSLSSVGGMAKVGGGRTMAGLLHEAAFVGGRWLPASSAASILSVHNPATNALIGDVPMLDGENVVEAISFAKEAQVEWASL